MQAPMQSSSPRPPPVYSSFGERRSISHDLARFSLDLGPARPGASRPAHTVPYPSPPMSHSPPPTNPLSPKQQDARRRPSNLVNLPYDTQGMQGRAQEQLAYSHEQHQHHLQGPTGATAAPSSENEKFPAPFPSTSNGDNSYSHLTQINATAPGNQRSPFATQSPFLPPQLPRRTKSHVASACVNCKKAHLACDVRRPCPRCVSLGKQDSCKDVQHKKRGRPRLRDERTHSFEVGQIGSIQSHRAESVVSPLSSPTAIPVAYRAGTHRVLKSQSTESSRFRRASLTPREETLGGQNGGYFDDRPSPITPRFNLPSPVPSAVAYLTTELVVAKSTQSVHELLGYSAAELNGVRSLFDIVLSSDRDKLYRLSRRIQEDMSERGPSYLPPLSSHSVYAAIQNVTQSDIPSAIQGSKELQETLHLRHPDGRHLRTRVTINLAKTSVFFVVVVFSLSTDIPPPLQFNNQATPFQTQERVYTPGHSIPPIASPPFMGPSQQRLQGEPSGPQSPYSLHPHTALRSPIDSRPRTMQSDFPSLAQYAANSSAPSPGFPPVRRPISPASTGTPYENSEPPINLQLPPLQLKSIESNGNDWDRGHMSAPSDRRQSDSSTPRRERIDVHEMLE